MKAPKFLLTVTLVFLAIAGGYAVGKFVSAPPKSDALLNSCPSVMAKIIQSAQGSVYEVSATDSIEPETHYLASYSVLGDLISTQDLEKSLPSELLEKSIPIELKDEQNDRNLHEQAWDLFTLIIPPQDREMVADYIVFTDGYSNTLAAVEQTPDDLARWIMEVDIADLKDADLFLFTLVHEYAHLLTLNSSQVTPDPEIFKEPNNLSLIEEGGAACSDYFPGDGCSHPDSYINEFYQRFWVDINDEWKAIDALQYDEDPLPYYEGLYDFYEAHTDEFVDDYATTHPAEDIAESFAYFVFSPMPLGNSIKEQKIAFFYQYPELLELRSNILQNICTGSP